jgi:uncharacterized protein (TIGR02246 family)
VSKVDEDAIRETEARFNEAWGRHDPGGMVESLTDDAQFVTVNGAWTKTRAEYLDLMQRLHGSQGPFRVSTRETYLIVLEATGSSSVSFFGKRNSETKARR